MPLFPYSFAFDRFMKNHAEANEYYWHAITTKRVAKVATDFIPREYRIAPFLRGFNHRNALDFQKWEQDISNFENWLRLTILLAANSYLEQYLYEITSIAFFNNPSLLRADWDGVNGIQMLKYDLYIKGAERICKSFITGEWKGQPGRPGRVGKLESHFPCLVNALPQEIIEKLDIIRLKRNKIAHFLGRESPCNPNDFFNTPPNMNIDETELIEHLKLIHEVTKEIDGKMFPEYIDDIEILIFWHNRDSSQYPSAHNIKADRNLLKKLLAQKYSWTRRIRSRVPFGPLMEAYYEL